MTIKYIVNGEEVSEEYFKDYTSTVSITFPTSFSGGEVTVTHNSDKDAPTLQEVLNEGKQVEMKIDEPIYLRTSAKPVYIGKISMKDSPEVNQEKLRKGFGLYADIKAAEQAQKDLGKGIANPPYEETAKKIFEDWNKKVQEETEKFIKEIEDEEGVKESKGKLFYEFDWEFIEAAAKRMQENKGKYEPFNWKKKIDPELLLQSINRHHIEVMKGNYKDGEDELGHIVSYFCNAMMLYHQLKNHK